MPSLINNPNNPDRDGAIGNALAQNYRKSRPSTRFGTPELVHALITISNINASDYDTVDGNFYRIVSIIQKFAEIYAIGEVQYGEGGSSLTVILKAGTVTDANYTGMLGANPRAGELDTDLSNALGESVSVNYTTMYGLNYD